MGTIDLDPNPGPTRVGFASQANSKTVIRSGCGIHYRDMEFFGDREH